VSYMREHLALRLLNDIGVPSQRSVYVRLFLNGDFYGLYLLVEQLDSTWLERQRWPADTMLLKAQHWKVLTRVILLCLASAPALVQTSHTHTHVILLLWGLTDLTLPLPLPLQYSNLRAPDLHLECPQTTPDQQYAPGPGHGRGVGCPMAYQVVVPKVLRPLACWALSRLSALLTPRAARRQMGSLARRAYELAHNECRAGGEPRLLLWR